MTLYHCTTAKKLNRYEATGGILPPIRGWTHLKKKKRIILKEIVGGSVHDLG